MALVKNKLDGQTSVFTQKSISLNEPTRNFCAYENSFGSAIARVEGSENRDELFRGVAPRSVRKANFGFGMNLILGIFDTVIPQRSNLQSGAKNMNGLDQKKSRGLTMENLTNELKKQYQPQAFLLPRRPKILLIDDDPSFCNLMVKLGELRGITIEAFQSFLELQPFSEIETYDGIIFDYHLEHIDGIQIMTALRPFFIDKPMMLISADNRVESELDYLPMSQLRAFADKKFGSAPILDTMQNLLERAHC